MTSDRTAGPRRWALVVVPVVVAALAALVTQAVRGAVDDALVPVLVAAAGGLVLGLLAVAIARRSRRRSVRSPRDLADIVTAPNLAVVPRHPLGAKRPDDVTMFREPNSVEAEGYRTLRTALEFVMRDPSAAPPTPVVDPDRPADEFPDVEPPRRAGPGTILLVTSPRPGEGKSSVAANLAAASAMAGRRVVLVDGDLRKPQVHRLFRLRNQVGLTSVLDGTSKLGEAVQRLEGVPNLAVLTAGPPPPDPAEMLANDRLGPVLAGLAHAADLVVVDAPPVLAVTDPAILVQHCDVTLLVATAGFSDRGEWAEAMPRLAVVGATVVGTVLLQPDDRVQSNTTYRYAPSAVPPNWWVASASATTTAATDSPPAAATEPPAAARPTATATEMPATTDEPPAAGHEPPPVTSEPSGTAMELPAVTVEPPVTTEAPTHDELVWATEATPPDAGPAVSPVEPSGSSPLDPDTPSPADLPVTDRWPTRPDSNGG